MSQQPPPRTADQVVDQAQQTAGQVVDGAQEKVGQVVDQAKQQTTALLATRKDQAAGALYTVGHALRQTGQQLREQDQTAIAGYADQAAMQVERVSRYLQDRDMRQLVDDTEGFARQRPVVFVGGALTLGLLAARFLKSSKRKATPPPGQTIPAERALIETTPSSTAQAASGAPLPMGPATPSASDMAGTAPVRVSSDEPAPAVVAGVATPPAGSPSARGTRASAAAVRQAGGAAVQPAPGARTTPGL